MKYRPILFWFMLFASLASFLQITGRYHFFYIEQLQLFQFTGDYIAQKIYSPGGMSSILGEFLTQFFITPYAGPILVAGLLTSVGLSTRHIIKSVIPEKEPFILYLLPPLSLLLIHYEFNYLLQGTVAYLLALLCLNGIIRIPRFQHRLWMAVCAAPILFWTSGPVAGLFAMSLFIWEIIKHFRLGMWMMIVVAEVFLIGIGGVWMARLAEYRFAFLPDAYYHPILETPPVLYFAWICLPLCLVASWFYPHKNPVSKKGKGIEITVQFLAITALAWYCIPRYDDRKSYRLKELDYYNRTGQWDQIIRQCQGPVKNLLYLNYLNRALAEKGILADRLFAFDQHGAQGLLVNWNRVFSVSTLLSDVYYTLGETALSQKMAFESYITSIGAGNPRNLQRLVETNLILGNYPVAEKYIHILENTYAYRDWARRHRIFLNNDEAINKDPLLGSKRKALPAQDNLASINGLEADLLYRAEQNPQDQRPIQFTGALYLLSKDMKSFQALIERYYGTPALPSLPISFQEAVILLAEHDTDYWTQFHLSESVIQRFTNYRRLILQNRNDVRLAHLVKNSFGDTYWSYYMFN